MRWLAQQWCCSHPLGGTHPSLQANRLLGGYEEMPSTARHLPFPIEITKEVRQGLGALPNQRKFSNGTPCAPHHHHSHFLVFRWVPTPRVYGRWAHCPWVHTAAVYGPGSQSLRGSTWGFWYSFPSPAVRFRSWEPPRPGPGPQQADKGNARESLDKWAHTKRTASFAPQRGHVLVPPHSGGM